MLEYWNGGMGYWGDGVMGRVLLNECMDAWMHDCI
jgi:hypothetical protein